MTGPTDEVLCNYDPFPDEDGYSPDLDSDLLEELPE